MWLKRNIFNSESVNIFTDASLSKDGDDVIVCSGFGIYIGDVLIDQKFDIIHRSTISVGELTAIRMGVYEAIKYQRFPYVRIFSDSQSSIFAIRDRIFNWVNQAQNGKLLANDGALIANQELIMEIVYYILQCNLHIEFYHIKGHIRFNDFDELQHAKEVFSDSNFITDKIDDILIRTISMYNDQVDKYTGIMLNLYRSSQKYINPTPQCISLGYAPFDTALYKQLISPKEIPTK